MAQKIQNILFIGLAIVLIAYAVMNLSSPIAGTVVSFSQISYDAPNGDIKWVGNLVLDQFGEALTFRKENITRTLSDGSTLQANSNVQLQFIPKTPKQQYQLFGQVYKTILFGDIPYYTFGAVTRSVPYDVVVTKNGNTLETKSADASVLGSSNFTMQNGNILITNLGQLSNGVESPSNGTIIPTYVRDGFGVKISGYKLVSSSDFDSWKRQLNQGLNVFAIYDILVNPPVDASEFVVCTKKYIDTPTNQLATTTVSLSGRSLICELPNNASNASVTISIDKSLFDAVIVSPPKGEPQVTANLSRSTLNQTQSSTYTVTIKNIGTGSDTFEVIPNTSNGSLTISPVSNRLNIAAGSASIATFNAYGFTQGSGQLCVTVKAIGSLKTANTCTSYTVNQNVVPTPDNNQPVGGGGPTYIPPKSTGPIGGNGVCEFGEQITYPADCGISTTPPNSNLPPLVCGFGSLPYETATPQYLLFWQVGTQNTRGCGPDYTLYGLGFLVLVLFIFNKPILKAVTKRGK